MALDQGKIEITKSNGIATLEFFHPLSNSLPSNLLAQLHESIITLGSDNSTKVIIMKSSGERAFCAGASFDELLSIQDKETGKEFFSGFARVINAMRKCPKFILGRIHGKTVGGGVGLAAAMDYCFATNYASIKLSELSIGIGPFVIGPVVIRKIGVAAFSELSIQATEWKSPKWAKEKGLYSEVFDTTEMMDQAIELLATRLAKSNPEAMTKTKAMFWQGTENWDNLLNQQAAMSGELVLSEFTRKSLQSFKK